MIHEYLPAMIQAYLPTIVGGLHLTLVILFPGIELEFYEQLASLQAYSSQIMYDMEMSRNVEIEAYLELRNQVEKLFIEIKLDGFCSGYEERELFKPCIEEVVKSELESGLSGYKDIPTKIKFLNIILSDLTK